MTTVLIAALTPLVALFGAYLTYKLGKRKNSGAIDTSEAAELWTEGKAIREDLRTDLADTKQALVEAVAAITALNEEIRLSREETRGLRKQIVELTDRTADLHKDVRTGNGMTESEDKG
ncbi:MAG: hypothetical protein WKF96_00160 [Solirubrobacteraceae bacterium]